MPDTSTTEDLTDTKDATPAEALFQVSRNGDDFHFIAVPGTSPAQFTALYGTGNTHSVPVKMYANDGATDSAPLAFTISVSYDASPQFHTPAQYQVGPEMDLA